MHRLLLILIALTLGGCGAIRAVIGITKPTDHFIALESNNSIRYEPGAGILARHIEAELPRAMQIVQQRQGNFSRVVLVHVTASVNNFAEYCTTPRAAACVIKNRLFMAPRLLRHKDRIAGILTHELSHLQLNQAIGS